MAPSKPFQLLEINIISAQDLEPLSRKMRTYATAWMHQSRKLSSCVDNDGKTNPTWNDKFVFRVDDEFLRQDTSAIMIEIYAAHWFRDVLVGTVRVLVGNLIPPPTRTHQQTNHYTGGMRFVALQVRRPSGRPQGILNIGVALLDSSMRSMPLYRQLSMSAVGFRDLMDGPQNLPQQAEKNIPIDNNAKPVLRRSKSERSELVGLDHFSPNSSMILVKGKAPEPKESSIISISECIVPFKNIGKASSVINGAELREKPRQRGKKGKEGSVVSDSIVSKESTTFRKNETPVLIKKIEEGNTVNFPKESKAAVTTPPPVATIGKPVSKYVIGAPAKKGGSIWSDSEVGPSPSEVAAAIADQRRYPLEDNQSSVLDGWSVDESVEGLRSKLDRWRMELPPLYDDRGGCSSSSYKSSTVRHARRHTDNGSGLFSCFGNIFGYECQCVCGKPSAGKRSASARFHNSPSTLTPGRSFL
ncbi:hypothetical protein ACP275_07G055000 [Erythranthe tilingii]